MKAKVTYGTLRCTGSRWVLENVPPHVAIRLKSVFARIPKTQTETFDLPCSDEMSADLFWFESRYPMKMTGRDRAILEQRRDRYEVDQAAIEAILLPDFQPSLLHGFRPGYAPYHSQNQAIALWHKKRKLLLGDDVGQGKEQPLTAKILTPSGWSTMGQMTVGTEVLTRDGSITRVTAVHPQGVKSVYAVTFSDGARTECGADHLWIVRDQNRRLRGNGWATHSLSHLLKRGILHRSGAPKWEIPLHAPLSFRDGPTELPVDPYLLGALLGDGSVSGENIAISIPPHENETLERIRMIVGPGRVTGPFGGSCPQWHILGERPLHNSVARGLKAMGLRVTSRHKFVPELYLLAPASDRLELLRGLMDTDGSARNNRVTFHTCADGLARGVAALARSLGGTATVRRYDRTHQGKPVEFQVNVRLNECPFHLSRKVDQWRRCGTHGRVRRYIRTVELIGEAPQQCISVEAHDGAYITDDYVVTHNTWVALGGLVGSPYMPAAIVVQAHLPSQWVNEFIVPYTYLTAHIIQGTKPYSLPPANLYIFRYTNIAGWVDVAATGFFKAVVFDEIQEGRTGSNAEKGKAMKVFADNAEIRLGLSATPIFNYGSEIWNIMQYIDPDLLGQWEEFVREWCTMGPGGKWLVKQPSALGSYLRQSQVFLRRLRQGRRINRIVIDVDYDEDLADKTADLAKVLALRVMSGSFGDSGQAARELDALARQTTGVAKAKSVAAYVRILLASGVPVILAGWHRAVYDIWLEELAEFKPRLYTGSESPAQKDKAKKAFISGETNLLIISLRSGAGLDGLQKRCSTVVVGELDWAPNVIEQLLGRVDRPGQSADEITLIFCVCDAGSDPVIQSVNAVKRDQARGIMDPDAGLETTYSDISHIKMLAAKYLEESQNEVHRS